MEEQNVRDEVNIALDHNRALHSICLYLLLLLVRSHTDIQCPPKKSNTSVMPSSLPQQVKYAADNRVLVDSMHAMNIERHYVWHYYPLRIVPFDGEGIDRSLASWTSS
jgi:hypothetical protein